MERQEFKELILKAVQSKLFRFAVLLRRIGFALGIVFGILTVPNSMNPVSTIIGLIIGNCITLFLIILPLFEILRAKDSQNFRDDCDFGLKYLRVSTIITLVASVLLVIASLLLSVAVGTQMVIVLVLSGVLLAYSIFQLEIINDLRNGLFYNIEKISYAGIYFALTLVFSVATIVFHGINKSYFDLAAGIINSASQIIVAYFIFAANNKWKKEKLLSD